MKSQFKTRQTFSLLCLNASLVHAVLAYILFIPESTTPTWNALNKVIIPFEIDPILTVSTFALGAVLSLGFEIKGTLRQKIIKCDISLIVVMCIQPFVHLTVGTLVVRFFEGIILSMNIRYTDKYLQVMSKIVYIFQSVRLFGFAIFLNNAIMFWIGALLSVLFSIQMPNEVSLKLLFFYDDTLLWHLLNALPAVIVALRCINMSITFAYDSMQENGANTEQNEHILANIFKKKNVETAWEMLSSNQFDQGNQQFKIRAQEDVNDKGAFNFLTFANQTCGLTLGLFYFKDLLMLSKLETLLQMRFILAFIILSLLAVLLTKYLYQRIPLEVIFIIGQIGSIVCTLLYLLEEVEQSPTKCAFFMLCSFIFNVFGLFSIESGLNYYSQWDESLVFQKALIRWITMLLFSAAFQFKTFHVVIFTLAMQIITCFVFCNKLSIMLSNIHQIESPETPDQIELKSGFIPFEENEQDEFDDSKDD